MIYFFSCPPVSSFTILNFCCYFVNQKGYSFLKGSVLENLVKVFVSFVFATLSCKYTEKNREARELVPSGAF